MTEQTGIKIGAHQLSWGTQIAEEDVFPRAKKAKELGCEAFEFFLNADPFPGPKIKQVMEQQVKLTPIGCAVITEEDGDPLSTDRELRLKAKKAIETFIERTCAMGGSLLVGPIANVLGRKDARPPTQKQLEAGVEIFRELAMFAKLRQVRIAIEPLQWSEMPWPNTVQDVLVFIDYVEQENNFLRGVLGVLFDIYHANRREENCYSALKLALNTRKLFHMHVAGPNRTPPRPEQHIDWASIMFLLKQSAWSGTITIESFGEECDLPYAVVGPGERLPAEDVIRTGVATLKTLGL